MEGKRLNPAYRQEKYSCGVPTRRWWPIWSLALFLSLSGLSHGARSHPLYVSDTTVEANLWNGIKGDRRIVAMLRPGTQLTLLREDEGWAEVALQDGRRGWILKRYLSERPSWMTTAQQLEAENQKLREQVKGLGGSQHETAQENDRLKRDLEETRQTLGQMQKTFDDAKFSGRLRWFLSGAAVVLVGWILGFWTGRARRRRSSDLYR
jgi:SH3 domain protein